MSDLERGPAPPAPIKRGLLLRVLTAEATIFVCLSRSRWSEFVHWWGGRSHECKGDKSRCMGCQKGWPVKWKGYFHVAVHGAIEDTFLELTPSAFHALEAQAPKGENFRGLQFKIRRTKGGAKGRYICEVLDRRIPDEELPQEKDPRPLLKFLRSYQRSSCQQS